MLRGAMPGPARTLHKFGPAIVCVVFAGLAFVNFRAMSAAGGAVRAKGPLIVILVLAAIMVAAQLRFQRRLIVEFSYDGSILQFRTLGQPELQAKPANAISRIKDWRGRGGQIGYRLIFRDGEKAYLENAVSNASELVARVIATT